MGYVAFFFDRDPLMHNIDDLSSENDSWQRSHPIVLANGCCLLVDIFEANPLYVLHIIVLCVLHV